MESSRQESFRKLRPVCVELSSVGFAFRGHQATSNDVLRALEPVSRVLQDLGQRDALDEKLAEYSFFPLVSIFNETRRVSARCLEIAVKCVTILVEKGWRNQLSPQMGKQLVILMTLIVGETPDQRPSHSQQNLRPVELAIECFNCLEAVFHALQGPAADHLVYHEIGTATIVDQTVYLLLDGIGDERSDEVCVAAGNALQALHARITDRLVLASIMPRTVSALTKVIRPTTQIRRSYRLLKICLEILTQTLRDVLGDDAVTESPHESIQPAQFNERSVLDESWLKATVSQIKLALANVVQIRRHGRAEVRDALLRLCLTVIENCSQSLRDSLQMMVETVVVLSDADATAPNDAFTKLKFLSVANSNVTDILHESLHTWITSFPRIMQSNDETAKQWGIKQISVAFQILSQSETTVSDILSTALASGLCESVAAAVNFGGVDFQPLSVSNSSDLNVQLVSKKTELQTFPPVILEHQSQQRTLQDLQKMITRLTISGAGDTITRSIINRIHQASENSIIAPFWLALSFLRAGCHLNDGFDNFIVSGNTEPSSSSSRVGLIEELYYIALQMLSEEPTSPQNWRISALAVEAIALQAQQLGQDFRPELIDALYPTLQLFASGHDGQQRHAMTSLNVLASACNYADVSSMIIENADYLTNSVALKLNMFDVSPYPSQILLMMVRLCGAKLVPYLDDLVESLFGIIDMYHGYPKLVEIMFTTLAAIVEEATRNPSSLAITGDEQVDVAKHRKRQYQRVTISKVAEDFASWKQNRARWSDDQTLDGNSLLSHPVRPWGEDNAQSKRSLLEEDQSLSDNLEQGESDELLPPPREPGDAERPLSKSHQLVLNIVKAIPPHLASPSPYLRRSLLSILLQVIPVLSHNEDNFLPLINQLWPAVATKVTFPASMHNDASSSTALLEIEQATSFPPKKASENNDHFNLQEETFVIVAACNVIQAMCEYAGDFMTSRVEADFPRWERLYRRAWQRVGQDAERALERRAHQKPSNKSGNLQSRITPVDIGNPGVDFLPGLGLAPSSSLTTLGGPSPEPGNFTPHHSLWKALTLLFITLLTHVRLPLHVGDQICEFLATWIVRYAGPRYYFCVHLATNSPLSGSKLESSPSTLGHASKEPGTFRSAPGLDASVEEAIRAMEVWNADLTWFVFRQQSARVAQLMRKDQESTSGLSGPGIPGGLVEIRFADIVF